MKILNKEELLVDDIWSMINKADLTAYAEKIGLAIERAGKTTKLKDHDSCIFFEPNRFFRFSNSASGNLFQFIIEFQNVSRSEAFKMAKEYVLSDECSLIDEDISKPVTRDYSKGLVLPPKNDNAKKVVSYLCNERNIPYKIVKEYLSKNLLYQEKYGNCIFVGELNGKPYYAMRRSTYVKDPSNIFKGDVSGSFKEVGIYFNNNSSRLVLTEAVIDQMSYMALFNDESNSDFLSINGVASAEKTFQFHLAKRHDAKERLKEVVIAFDNDGPGIEAADKLKISINESYPELNVKIMIPHFKDWNEDLCSEMNDLEVIHTELNINELPNSYELG